MEKPNVLFLLTDDQRFDTIHAIGNEQIHTPNIDKLVARGSTFTHGHIMGGTCGAVCMPSRAMLMTGRTLFHLSGKGTKKGAIIPEKHVTLPECFRKHGYQSYHVGKWHQDRASFNRSFEDGERIFGFYPDWYKTYGGHWNLILHDYDESEVYDEKHAYMYDENYCRVPVGKGCGGIHSSEVIADGAIHFLEKKWRKDKPFFLYVSFVAPHDPRQAPNVFEEMYNTEDIDLPENYLPKHPFDNGELYDRDEMLEGFPRREHAIKRHIADYYGMISHLDQQIGRILDELEKSGEQENTIIVFAADNGLALGQHGLMGKQNVYEHSVRVPLIMSGPMIPKGMQSDNLCYLLDVFPTLCELANFSIPFSVEGISLKPIIDRQQTETRRHLLLGYKNYQRAIREKRYKFIRYEVGVDWYQQLFDLESDPYECVNVINEEEYAYQKKRLEKLLIKERNIWE